MVQFCSLHSGGFSMHVAQVNFVRTSLNPLFTAHKSWRRVLLGRAVNSVTEI